MLKEVLEVFHTLKESRKVPQFPGNVHTRGRKQAVLHSTTVGRGKFKKLYEKCLE